MTKQQTPIEETLVSPEAGLEMSGGISDSTRRRLIAAGDYPKPIVLSRDRNGRPLRVAWIASELHEWIAKRIAVARAEQDRSSKVDGEPSSVA